jgi:hypothetical protein
MISERHLPEPLAGGSSLALPLASLFLALAAPLTAAQEIVEPIPSPGGGRRAVPGVHSGTPIDCGTVVQDEFDEPGQRHWYSYQGMAGEVLDMTLVKTSGFASSFPLLSVKTPSGAVLGEVIGTALATLALPETGEYGFRVWGSGAGSYAIGQGCRPTNSLTVPTLDCDTSTSASIDVPGELDYYVFDGSEGEEVRISLVETSGFPTSVPRATLIAPSGAILGTLDANGARTFVLAEDGTHIVRVQANDLLGTGTYNLGRVCFPPQNPTVVTCGHPPYPSSGGAPGEVWIYTFDASLDQVLDLSVGGGAGSLPQLRVFDPLGGLVGVFTSDSLTSFTAGMAGTYTVQVGQADFSATGDYAFALSCRPPAGPSTLLPCGGMVLGTLVAAEMQYYTFSGLTGDVAEITLTETAGFPGTSAPRMRVFAPSGLDLGAFTADSTNPITLPEDGTYTVRVSANTVLDTGSYAITLLCLPPTGIIHLGDDVIRPDSILATAPQDTYTFEGSAGEVIEIPFVVTSGFSGTAARATLLSPTSVNLGSFNSNILKEFTLPETGLYTVTVVAANGTGTGTYNIGFERRVNPNMEPDWDPESPPLACGQVISGSIDLSGEVDYLRFDGQAGAIVELALVKTGGFSGSTPRAILYRPDGTALGSSFDGNSLNTFTLPDTGLYLLRVWANTLVHTGSYNLGLSCRVPLGPVDADLSCGDLETHEISVPGEVDYFTLSGQANDIVEIALTKDSGFSGSVPRGALFDPNGNLVGTSFDGNSLTTFTLPVTGLYRIRVWANTLVHTGTYSIGRSCRAPLGPVVADLSCGDLESSDISARGEVDYFTLSGQANDIVEIALTKDSGFSSSVPRGALFDPNGNLVGTSFDGNSLTTFTLPVTGLYRIRVWANTLVHTGTYSIGRSCRVPLGPVVADLSCGDLESSDISARGEVDYFTLSGQANDIIEIALTKDSGFSGSVPRGALYDPNGNLVGTSFDGNSLTTFTLPVTGLYRIRVWANTLVHTGTYSIGLGCP